ncbi:MAG: HYR domain-containing protein, partial [Saprospiraceae bacterium]|nr:HYR domain-containing protein [Saprospiraceae bacterium]
MIHTTKHMLVVLAFVLHTALLFGQDSLCISPTFYHTLGSETGVEYATAILHASDGYIYLTGRNNNQTFIRKMALNGATIWTRGFQINAFEPMTPAQMIEDSEGMIVGCGTQGVSGLTKGAVFRYNPNTNTFLWAHSIASNNPTVAGIVEITPGGNFLLCQNSLLPSSERDAEIIEINRATGIPNLGLAKRYEYLYSDVFSKIISINGDLYVTGWATSRYNTFVNARRQLLMQVDPGTLEPIWAHMNHLDTLAPTSTYGRDLISDGDTSLISAYGGTQEGSLGSGVLNDTLYLQKTDLNGNIQWVRQYNILSGVLKLLNLPDGYLIYGQRNGNEHFAFKTDKQGVPVWGRKVTDGPANGSVFLRDLAPNQAVVMNDSLYFTGLGTTGNADVFLWKLLSNGVFTDTCGLVDTLMVPSFQVANPQRYIAEFTTVFSTATSVPVNPPILDVELPLNQVCPSCDTPVDPCPQGNDFELTITGLQCVDGKINLQYQVCDLDGGSLDQLNISFYNGNPFTTAADRIYNFSFNPVSGDSCHQGTLLDITPKLGDANVEPGDVIYALVNVAAGAVTPIDPNDYPTPDNEECNYANNLEIYTIQYPQFPTLNLGPDQTVCAGTGALLNAGSGFYKYQWSNGAVTPFTLVNFSGQFRVTVTDDCGFRQTDTVEVTVLPAPTQVFNGAFCPGRSVTIKGFTFNQAGTFQQTLPGLNGACDTIATFFIDDLPYENRNEIVRFCPGDTITINGVEYWDSGLAKDTVTGVVGCDTIVFYFLQQLPQPFRFDDVFICPGDSVFINGAYYDSEVTVKDTLLSTSSNGCDTLLWYNIHFLPQVILTENISFCQGGSVFINGQEYTDPGSVDVILPGQNGDCDSTLRYILTWLPTFTREEDLLFCPGTTVTIGGTTYSQPGDVELFIPGSGGGCDTLVTYHLDWLPYQSDNQLITFCPGQTVTIGGQIYTQPGTVLDTIISTAGDCDVIVTYVLEFRDLPTRSETISFCNGETVTIAGQNYTQPGIVTVTEPGIGNTCDTIVTYTLEYVTLEPSDLTVTCPFNVNIITIPGTGQVTVNYNLPTAVSDCVCPGIEWTLTQGFSSGSLFPPGMTKVCYTGRDSCGSSANCCFDVIVREEAACETKVNGCIKYDILSITKDQQQRHTYKIRVTNNCSAKLIYTAIQLPSGILATQPANNSIYTSPEGLQYLVRNPNFTPFYSIRFRSGLDSIANGQSATFEFTLPAQSVPLFFEITSRLAPQTFVA